MSNPDFSNLSAVFINCSLKADPGESHTARLMARVAGVMRSQDVAVEIVHARQHDIAFGMEKDMTKHGAEADDWPALQSKVEDADILVLGTPIWLGVKSSVASMVIERLYAYSSDANHRGQYVYYGKTAGCVVTGNEDGVKACARDVLYAMQHIGFMVPPGADCGWIGEIGPGPSYGDDVDGTNTPAGYDSEFTNKNATVMAWNLMHAARLIRSVGGWPTMGNTIEGWSDVANAADQNPAAS